MDAAKGRTEGNHVQIRELLQEQAAFETGVDGLHLRLGVEELSVGVHGDLQDAGVQIGLPARILAVVLRVEGAQEEGGFHPLGHRMQFGNDGTALAGDDFQDIAFDVRRGQV